MRILFLSHTYWGSPYRIGSHHLSAQMAMAGHEVFYVSTPMSLLHFLKYPATNIRRSQAGHVHAVRERLHQWIPLTMLPAGEIFLSGFDASALGLSRQLQEVRSVCGADDFDVVFIDEPRLAGFLRFFPARCIVYRPTDIYAAMGIRRWRKLESHILQKANCLVCTSGPLLDFLRTNFQVGCPARVQVNGVDYEHFLTPRPCPDEYRGEPGQKCLYVGALDFRFDFDAFSKMAAAAPDVCFYIIGGGEEKEIERLRGIKNVRFLGFRSYDDVPAYMQHADVAILPARPGESNDGRSPMKIYEYLACGLPVLAFGTQELQRRSLPGVFFYAEHDEIGSALRHALSKDRQSYVDQKLHWRNIAEAMLED